MNKNSIFMVYLATLSPWRLYRVDDRLMMA